MIATFVIIWISLDQMAAGDKSANAAVKATEIAQQALNDARKNDDLSSIQDGLRFTHDTMTTRTQIEALEGQVKAMNKAVGELRNQFRLENEPILGPISLYLFFIGG